MFNRKKEKSMAIDQSVVGALLAILGESGRTQFEKDAWKHRDTDIKYEGKHIVLPGDPGPMPIEAAITTLKRKLDEENQMMNVHEIIPGYPFDAAVGFLKAMQETYGWASSVATPGFWGPTPPSLITVKTGPEYNDTMQVPIGSFLVPGVTELITTGITPDGNFHVRSKCRKREKGVIMELVALAKKIIERESIYRGKALSITVDDDGDLNRSIEPEFLPTKHIVPSDLILSKSVEDLIEDSVFTPVRHTAECKRAGIPLRRSILLEGPFGTGKTLTATVASKVCVDNGWTFITLDKVQGLKEALLFARQYQPAMIFAEDIDRIAEIRDDETNDLLNIMDGILTKDSKVITILTTNFVERIDRAMMRPGRLDAIINYPPPDADAAARLVRLYARGKLAADEPINRLGKELSGQIPATIQEVVERAKLGMIRHNRSMLTEDDLLVSAAGMKRHLELLNRPTGPRQTTGERLAETLREVVTDGVKSNGHIPTKVKEQIDEIHTAVVN
jgi:transitional endoplasmic reticulum ATPase